MCAARIFFMISPIVAKLAIFILEKHLCSNIMFASSSSRCKITNFLLFCGRRSMSTISQCKVKHFLWKSGHPRREHVFPTCLEVLVTSSFWILSVCLINWPLIELSWASSKWFFSIQKYSFSESATPSASKRTCYKIENFPVTQICMEDTTYA